jgi:hypothetical protein
MVLKNEFLCFVIIITIWNIIKHTVTSKNYKLNNFKQFKCKYDTTENNFLSRYRNLQVKNQLIKGQVDQTGRYGDHRTGRYEARPGADGEGGAGGWPAVDPAAQA